MNNSFLLLAGIAIAVGLGLFLLVAPAEPVSAPEPEVAVVENATPVEVVQETQTQYWTPVQSVTSSAVSYVSSVATPCGACGTIHSVPVAAVTTSLQAGGCGGPVSPCAQQPACSTCPARISPCARPTPAAPCGAAPCASVAAVQAPCGNPDVPCDPARCSWSCGTCVDRCAANRLPRPGINRNLPACLDECGFVQLHSTAPHSICSSLEFRWAASRGSFLDPTSSDPLYYAPTVRLRTGEDVVITLTVTERSGAQHTDHVVLHVRDVP